MADDDLVEGLAERLYEHEWPRFNPDGSDDSNYWSWHGRGNGELLKDVYRLMAKSAVDYINEHTGKDSS